jgi:hypothetical protein
LTLAVSFYYNFSQYWLNPGTYYTGDTAKRQPNEGAGKIFLPLLPLTFWDEGFRIKFQPNQGRAV